MLPKDLRRISRAGGGYHPQFVGEEDRDLAARVIGIYQGHVGNSRGELRAALEALERESDDFKLVRGFAKLLEREARFEVRAPLPPRRARRAAYEAAEAVGVVTEEERARALSRAADGLGVEPAGIEESLYADRERREVLAELNASPSPGDLVDQYNRSLAASALFDATEVRVRSSDPRRLVSAVKRLGLLYEVERTDEGRELVVTGPTRLFGPTRRYGTRFARLLDAVADTEEWALRATVDDRGTERELRLSDEDPIGRVGAPDGPSFDSAVEADFAARFESLDLDWDLRREPEPLETGRRVMIPDFAFDYRHAEFRVYFEIMGFWTPEYVEKKLSQLADLEDVELIVAYDESLRLDEEDDRGDGDDLGAAIDARGGRAIPYRDRVRVKDVRDALRTYERGLVDAARADLPAELVPEDDVVTIEALADRRGVSERAIEDVAFPEHERVGRTLIRPAVLDDLDGELEAGMSLEAAEQRLAERGIGDASAVLSTLGYRVEWEGLAGGTLARTE